jgi:DNA-directed RNA polymerase subunit beta'
LYLLNAKDLDPVEKVNRFIEAGEVIFASSKTNSFVVQKLSYLEFLTLNGLEYFLSRPVKTFKVPEYKGFSMEHRLFPNEKTQGIAFRTVKRIFYKDGERVKSNCGGVNLLQTFLVLDIKNKYRNLSSQIDYILTNQTKTAFKLNVTLYESILITENTIKKVSSEHKVILNYSVSNNQYVAANTIIAKAEIITRLGGTLVAFDKTKTNFEILILTEKNIKKCPYKKTVEQLLIQVGDLVRVGTYLTTHTRAKYAGQIYHVSNNNIYIRLGRPYLISEGTVLRVNKND